jgi:hypothetical protein
MPQQSRPHASRSTGPTAEPSTTEAIRDEAADVGQHARQAGGRVAQTAADQARQVVDEAGKQARDLVSEARGQARDQASAQQQRAAQQLHSVADELGQMAAKADESGMAAQFARQAASRLHGAASWLEQREPADLLAEARNFARRRPGAFLIGAAVAGLAAGRVTRGVTAKDNGQPGDGAGTAGVPAAETTAGTGEFGDTAYPAGAVPLPEQGTAPRYERQ